MVTAAPAGQALDPEAERVEALADDGLCRHLSLAGLPPSLWRSAIRAASIVVDRVWLPGLGLAGMLGLEAGRPTVVGPTGLPAGAPVVRTRMAELDQTLRDLLVRAPSRDDRGAAFVADQRQHARQVLARLTEATT